MKRPLLLAFAAVALAACTPTSATSPHALTDATSHALRKVHSPGVVTDDMHLQLGQCHAGEAADGDPLPAPACTPGAIDPAVTQANIHTTICVPGYTATIRPPESNTNRWKRISEADYGDPSTFIGEYDHLVPLELGGANSTSNLWGEFGATPNGKDKVEDRLHREVCSGQLTLKAAQREIATDWTTAK